MFYRRSPLTRTVAAVMLATQATLLAACAGGDSPTQSSTQLRRASVSGEELFLGIFFGEGDVGATLPEIWRGKSTSARSLTPEKAARALRMERNIVSRLRTQDPEFFTRFAAGVTSGNHLEVEAAIVDAGKRLRGVADELTTQPSLEEEISTNVSVETETVLYFYVAGVIFLVVSLIDFTPVVEGDAPVSPNGVGGTRLHRDTVVDLIATRFAQ